MLQFLEDPFIDQFLKLFATVVGATLVAGGLWRLSYRRRKRKQREAWLKETARGPISS